MNRKVKTFTQNGKTYVHVSNAYQVRQRSGRAYEVEFQDAKGIWKSTKVWTLAEVEDAVSRMLCMAGKPTVTGLLFKEFAKNFFSRSDEDSIYYHNKKFKKSVNSAWYDAHQGRLDNYIMPKWGEYRLQDITDVEIERWYISLCSYTNPEKELADNTKNKIVATLDYIMQDAKRKRLIEVNPCLSVENLHEEHKKRAHFTIDEVRRLFPKDRMALINIWGSLQYALFFSIMVDTGWRCGEVSALQPSNFIDGGIYTECTVDYHTGEVKQSIKTSAKGQPYKVGILSDYTLALYDDFIKVWDKDYLFDTGNRLKRLNTPDRSNRILKIACDKAGVEINDRTEHCLRHSFDTFMLNKIDGDMSEADVRELMAHTGYRPEYDHRTGQDIINKLSGKIKPKIDSMRA